MKERRNEGRGDIRTGKRKERWNEGGKGVGRKRKDIKERG